MSITGPVAEFALGLADLFEPLLDRLSTPEELEYLFSRYGWRVSLDETVFGAISEGLAAREALQEFLDVAGPLRRQARRRRHQSERRGRRVARSRARRARSRPSAASRRRHTGGLPAPLNDEAFWNDIGEHLLDDLLEEYLRIYQPGTLRGPARRRSHPLRRRPMPEGPFRRPYRRIVFDWSQAQALVEDPTGALKKTYQWGIPGKPFDHALADRRAGARAACRSRRDDSSALPVSTSLPLPADSPYRIQADADALQTTFVYGVFARDRAIYEIGLQILMAAQSRRASRRRA